MCAGLLLATLAVPSAMQTTAKPPPAPLTLEIRDFNGAEEVTSQTRIAVHHAGDHATPVANVKAGAGRLLISLEPGVYDVQAIRERDGRAVGIRWAERLTVMPYPDEGGRHLEVINFLNGFGALEIVRRDSGVPDASVYAPGERARAAAQGLPGKGYLLFVLRAGTYDLELRNQSVSTWRPGFEIPLDRTRVWVVQ